MDIFNSSYQPPLEVKTDRFVIFPTDAGMFQSDYEAVMKTRDLLRIWSQSAWPEDDFKPEQNREDLQNHVDDNKNHSAYGYMIYSLDRKTCYGSLYVNPIAQLTTNYVATTDQSEAIGKFDARIDCWISSETSEELEQDILETIRKWFASEWKIHPFYSARLGMDRREKIYGQMGLRLLANLKSATSNVSLLVFH